METVEQTRLRIEAFIKENAPSVDISPGSVFSELLVKLQAQVQNEGSNAISDVSVGKYIADVLASSVDTYNEIIDKIASNYNTYRNEGKKANGQIKIVVSKLKNYYIPDNFIFEQPNLNFKYTTVTSYTISSNTLKTEGANYYFTIPIEAVEVGKEKQVSSGTRFITNPTNFIPELVDVYAIGAFVDGENKETDKELITRFRLGLTTKNLVSTNSIEAVLKDRYPSFKSVSVRGAGDVEMVRGKNNLIGLASPGFADVYVRNAFSLPTKTVTLSGEKISSSPDIWSITIPATTVPGFYKIVSIVKKGSNEVGTQKFNSVVYGYDNTNYSKKNNVNNAIEARFSKYQTCVVTFEYTSSGSLADFDVTFLYQPQIEEMQDIFLSDSERIPCADYLVKAIVPCNVAIKLKLVKTNELDTSVDIANIKTDIFNYVNSLRIGEALSASKLVDICHNYPIKRVDLPVQLSGTIIVPYNLDESLYISNTDILEIPNRPDKGVTNFTTSFFLNYFDEKGTETIGINVV